MSSSEDNKSTRTQEDAKAPLSQTNDTDSSYQPPKLQRQQSAHESELRQTVSTLERQPTAHLESTKDYRPQHDGPAPSTCTQQQSQQQNARESAQGLKDQQTKKKADQSFYVDNDYYALNPWYDHEPGRPLFSLGRPFPRTVRPGMLWGRRGDRALRKSVYKVERPQKGSGKEQGGQSERASAAQDDSEDPQALENIDEEQSDPECFMAVIDGQPVRVRRVESQEADQVLQQCGINREDHYRGSDEESHHSRDSRARHRYTSGGYESNLSPVRETTSNASIETSVTEQEKQEIRAREQEEVQNYYNNYRNPLARLRARYPEAPAEFIATTIYLFFGIAGNLYSITYPAQPGDFQTQSWAWGFAVSAGIYVGGGISGSHMSPWVSICFSVFRGFPWRMCLIYMAAQVLAGFAAGALAWFIYRDAILHIDPQLTANITGKALYAIPPTYVSTATAFFNNFVSATLYVCVAFAIGDDSNTPPGSGMSALVYGLMTYLLCITMGYNGLGVSPARDLGPRFIAWWVGYGSETFSTGWWAYGPIAAGLSGSLVGALIYDVFIFVGGESPVNYSWPGAQDIKWSLRERKERVKEKAQKYDV